MHSFARKFLIALGIISLLPSVSYATNGTFLIGAGAKIRSMGGAGVALPTSALSLAINPAHAAHLGIRADVDAMLFVPRRQACTRAVPNCAVSGSNLFLLPSMGGAYKFNRKIGMGFVGYANSGGSTRYDVDIFTVPGPRQTTGADVKQMIMAPSFAYKIDRQMTIGFAPLISIQQFRAYGLTNFATSAVSSDITNVTNRGNDWSYGAGMRIGFLGQFYKKKFSVGASYSSRIYMSELDKYAGLLSPNGEFDIPENYTVGIAVKPMDKLTVAFDIMRIMNSDVQALGNPISNTIGTSTSPTTSHEPKLGDQGGGGFGWNDQTVYKLGFAYDWDEKLTLNLGANYGKSPIPEGDELLPGAVAPATVEWHATLGLGYKISKKSEIALTYVHAFRKRLSNFATGAFPISPGGGATIEMVQNSGSLTYSFLF